MTSEVDEGRGVPKKQTKVTKSDDLWHSDRGGVENSADVKYIWNPPY